MKERVITLDERLENHRENFHKRYEREGRVLQLLRDFCNQTMSQNAEEGPHNKMTIGMVKEKIEKDVILFSEEDKEAMLGQIAELPPETTIGNASSYFRGKQRGIATARDIERENLRVGETVIEKPYQNLNIFFRKVDVNPDRLVVQGLFHKGGVWRISGFQGQGDFEKMKASAEQAGGAFILEDDIRSSQQKNAWGLSGDFQPRTGFWMMKIPNEILAQNSFEDNQDALYQSESLVGGAAWYKDELVKFIEELRQRKTVKYAADTQRGMVENLFDQESIPPVLNHNNEGPLAIKKKREVIATVLSETGLTKEEAEGLLQSASQ